MLGSFPARVVVVTAVVVALTTFFFGSSAGSRVIPPSAKALEAALLAPCCWNGTLDQHNSPVAQELREEIETRSAKGESTESIEADLVARYGSEIRAMPSVRAFTNAAVIGLDLLLIALASLAITVWRWRRQSRQNESLSENENANENANANANANAARDSYDERIDADLAEES